MSPGKYSRQILAIGAGIIGGYIPNTNSNIHPLLMGFILAILLVKILFGDYDKGYRWTSSDIGFGIGIGGLGIIGAWISQSSLQ